MSKFSKFFKNKKDEDDFYIALVVIVVFLIGGFYFGSSLLSNESPIVLNNITQQSTEIEGFEFENEEEKQLTTAILKDNKKQKQLDNWLDKTPKLDSTDVEKARNQLTANDDEISTSNDTEIIESRGTDTQYREDDETTENEIEQQKAEKARIAAENEANREAERIAQENLAAEKAKVKAAKEAVELKAKTDAKAKLAEKEAQAKAQAEAKRKADAKAKAELAAKKAKAEAKRKANAKATTYNCAIIVGSFETAEPADKLKATLIKQGYPAYTFFRKNLKVVGIKQSCNNEKAIQQQLAKLRKTFPEAWVLRK